MVVPASVGPQTPGAPPPPQISPAGHVRPHWRRPPQPSPAGPQLKPSSAQVFGTQSMAPPQTPSVPPPPQVAGRGARAAGELAAAAVAGGGRSSSASIAQVRGTQPAVPPHMLGMPPPPQVSGAAQLPHWRRPPQPSPAGPQLNPSIAQVRGTQLLPASGGTTSRPPRRPGWPPPPQVSGQGAVPAFEQAAAAIADRPAGYAHVGAGRRDARVVTAADAEHAAAAAGLGRGAGAALEQAAAAVAHRAAVGPRVGAGLLHAVVGPAADVEHAAAAAGPGGPGSCRSRSLCRSRRPAGRRSRRSRCRSASTQRPGTPPSSLEATPSPPSKTLSPPVPPAPGGARARRGARAGGHPRPGAARVDAEPRGPAGRRQERWEPERERQGEEDGGPSHMVVHLIKDRASA